MIDSPPIPPGVVSPIYSPRYAEHVQSLQRAVAFTAPVPQALPSGFSITNFSVGPNGMVTLQWQQGTPPFSVQASHLDGDWITLAITTNRSLSFHEVPWHFFRIVQTADLEAIPYGTGSAVKAWTFRKGDATATSYDLPGWGGYPESSGPTSQLVNGNTLILAGCPQGYGPPTIVEHVFTGTNFIKTGIGPKSGSNNLDAISCSLSNEVVIASWGMINKTQQTTHVDFLYRTAAGAWSSPLSLNSGFGNDPLTHSMCFGPDGLLYYFVNADSSHAINLIRLRRVNGQLQFVDDVIPMWNGDSWPPIDGEAGPSGEVAWMDAKPDFANNRVVVEYQQVYWTTCTNLPWYQQNMSKVVVVEVRPDKTWTIMDITPDYASHYLTSQKVYPFSTKCYLVMKCITPPWCTQLWEMGTMVNGGWSNWSPIAQTWSSSPQSNDDGYWVTPDAVVHRLDFAQ